MLIQGTFEIAAARERVWHAIRDPALMAGCIPGCETIEPIDPARYRTTVLVEVGPIKARFNLVVEILREAEPESIASTTRGEEGTRASILNAENLVSLAAVAPGRTALTYSSEVSLTGRLGKFGLGIMKKKAESLGALFAERLRATLEAGAARP